MRIPISDFAFLDLDAPTVSACAIPHEMGVAQVAQRRYRERWHAHVLVLGKRKRD